MSLELIIGICLAVGIVSAILLAYFIAFQHGYLNCKNDLIHALANDQVALEKIKAEVVALRLKKLTLYLDEAEAK